MTYNDISEAELKTLHQFAAALGIKLEEINGELGFTDDRNHDVIFRRDITKELITLIQETEEANGQDAWPTLSWTTQGMIPAAGIRCKRFGGCMEKRFRIGDVFGSYFTTHDPAAGEVYRNVEIRAAADPDGFTCVRAIITADSKGRVDVAWQHDDLTEGKLPIASYDLEYREKLGFWAAVKEHIAQLAAGEFPPECVEYDF